MINQNTIISNIVVGIDVHKRTHTAVIINGSFQKLETITFSNKEEEINRFLDQVQNYGTKNIQIGLEDTGGNGYLLYRHLSEKVEIPLYNIPSTYTDKQRSLTPHKEKTDEADALRVAEILLIKKDQLNQVKYTQRVAKSQEINGLISDREFLVKDQTRLKNQLHVLLHKEFGDDYLQQIKTKQPFSKTSIKEWKSKLTKTPNSIRLKLKLQNLEQIIESIQSYTKELEKITKTDEYVKKLKEINGCGIVTACKITGEIQDITKFKSSNSLAKYSGLAPREHSSSSRVRHYTDKSGNRRLNAAIHTIGLGQIGRMGTGLGKEYYKKKVSEGKSKLHALRCLKRKIVDVVFKKLAEV